jgi:hypothetical protein
LGIWDVEILGFRDFANLLFEIEVTYVLTVGGEWELGIGDFVIL